MRILRILPVLLFATAAHATCPAAFYRLVLTNQSIEFILDLDQWGNVSWTNAQVHDTVFIEKASDPDAAAPWEPHVTVLVTNIEMAVQLFDPLAPAGMTLVPVGKFDMGSDAARFPESSGNEQPVHTVGVNYYYIDTTEVTKAMWDEVWTWAVTNNYSFDFAGDGVESEHPVQSITWYDAVKWCNARSEMAGLVPAYYTSSVHDVTHVYRSGQVDLQNDWVHWGKGYRLPSEAEWEKAARGGLPGQRFPWGNFTNKISHAKANYRGEDAVTYDLSDGYHPSYTNGTGVYTSPAGSFEPNGYCLFDMAGNVWEWCWDWYAETTYDTSSVENPVGPETGTSRVLRGGGWDGSAYYARVTTRDDVSPSAYYSAIGFRCVLPVASP